jgi:subtilase family serine protease
MRRTSRSLSGLAALALLGSFVTAPAGAAQAAPVAVPVCAEPTPGRFRCLAVKWRAPARIAGRRTQPAGLSPADLRSAYRLPHSSTRTTVAVVAAYDNPNAESDLAVYRRTFGLPPCTTANGCFRKVNQLGRPDPLPPPSESWSGEISLDLDVVSAVCPTCRILLVEADDDSTNLLTAVETAVAMGATHVSMSWGTPEQAMEVDVEPLFDRPGVVFTAASGDSGYAGGTLYPAASAHVVSVGGTTLRRAANARGWTESVWAGSGSGCSAYLAKPVFQRHVPACTTRAVADVAAVGDPATGVAVYQTYGDSGWVTDGGTSLGAPLIAAAYALAGPPARHAPAYPYRHPHSFFDVTAGSTGSCVPDVLCAARRGWDGPTGLGTPNGVDAFRAWH